MPYLNYHAHRPIDVYTQTYVLRDAMSEVLPADILGMIADIMEQSPYAPKSYKLAVIGICCENVIYGHYYLSAWRIWHKHKYLIASSHEISIRTSDSVTIEQKVYESFDNVYVCDAVELIYVYHEHINNCILAFVDELPFDDYYINTLHELYKYNNMSHLYEPVEHISNDMAPITILRQYMEKYSEVRQYVNAEIANLTNITGKPSINCTYIDDLSRILENIGGVAFPRDASF